MINSTDVFAFKSKLNKLLNSVYTDEKLSKEEKITTIFYLNQVMEIVEQTLKT
jgi:hypothetical protein